MNLFRFGSTTLNMDRVNGIQDNPASAQGEDDDASHNSIRILFDDRTIELTGGDAQALRHWIRHNARNLMPRTDEDGVELLSPEDQLVRMGETLLQVMERAHPVDATARKAARRMTEMIERYITGELHPMRAEEFHRKYGKPGHESHRSGG